MRGGGPALSEKLVQLVLEKQSVRGSTGVIRLQNGQLSFTPNGDEAPTVSMPIVYQKKQ